MKIKMVCTAEDWHGLADAIDKAREGSKTIKVDKGALDRLMKDHSKFIRVNKDTLEGDT